MTEQLMLYKLIVLYMLNRIDFSMSYSQISDFILGRGYTDGFTLQSAVSELVEDDLIHPEFLQGIAYYSITPEGEETLGFLEEKVSAPIRADILSYLKENKLQLRNETSILSEYYRTTAGNYEARCIVREKQTNLIDLKLTVPEEEQAKAICNQWKNNSQEVYAWLMKNLMK